MNVLDRLVVFTSRLVRREEIAEGTAAFHFHKPAGFGFKPGQAIDLILGDSQDARHTFSLVSAPFESELVIATRMRDSAYKRALGSLPAGAMVRIEGPSGSLTLHRDRGRAAVFIAGGIGITPFISMLRQVTRDQSPQRISLIYSNRRPEDAAFLDELRSLEEVNKGFRLVATMTEMNKSGRPWHGLRAPIDEDLVRDVSRQLPAPVYYLAGPPAMVQAMRIALNSADVDDDDIRGEEFYGY